MAVVDLDKGIDRIGSRYDVCIVGSGPAGITLGLGLARRGLQVLICEGGGRGPTDRSHDVYRGESSPNYYAPQDTRLRFFGGSSNHWGRNVHLLEESDFAPRPAGATPGWPISYSDIQPYFTGAREWVGLPPVGATVTEVAREAGFPEDIVSAGAIRSTLLRYATFSSFAEQYRTELRETPGLTVALNANVVDVVPTTTGIGAVTVKNWRGKSTEVAADRFVFACGGFENPRLLLNFAERHGIFREVAPLIGTHFMEHMCIYEGALIVTNDDGLARLAPVIGEHKSDPNRYQWIGTVDPDARAEHGITTNVSFSLDAAWVNPMSDTTEAPEGLGARELLRLSGIDTGSDIGPFVTVRAEQSPNRASRVSLMDSTDDLGLKRARLDWVYAPEDHASIVRAVGMLARNINAAGIGRVYMPDDHTDWDSGFRRPVGGYHHMGTTRMSDSAATGVVDPNLRIHGTDNVYVAGSSVFSTGGWSHPTINLVAFSMRLADHLVAT